MKTSFQLSADDLSIAVTDFVAKKHAGINLAVHAIAIADGIVSVDAEVLARVKGPRKTRKPRAAKVTATNGQHAPA